MASSVFFNLAILFFFKYWDFLARSLESVGLDFMPVLGISLPMTEDAAWLVFYVLSLLVQLALFWQGKAYVQTTWAAAYETLCRQMEEQMAAQTQPEANLP